MTEAKEKAPEASRACARLSSQTGPPRRFPARLRSQHLASLPGLISGRPMRREAGGWLTPSRRARLWERKARAASARAASAQAPRPPLPSPPARPPCVVAAVRLCQQPASEREDGGGARRVRR